MVSKAGKESDGQAWKFMHKTLQALGKMIPNADKATVKTKVTVKGPKKSSGGKMSGGK